MIQREKLATAQVPGGAELTLYRHDRDHMIVLGDNELMSTRKWGSEEALATMAIDKIGNAKQPSLLIGGYGMGFTLRAALKALPANGHVTVVELVPEILEWARGPMAELTAGCLEDPRVTLVQSDVAPFIAGAHADNNILYSTPGLRAAKRALTADGVMAIWSAGPDPTFTRRLEKCDFVVDEVKVASRSNGKGPKHVIWFASKR
jgi:spermidine synthase